jgi:transposase InsO family protein
MEYLNRDMVHQMHQQIWGLKVQKPVIALSKLDHLEVDLINLSEWAGSNNSRRYPVSIIDCFSKYAWLLPITQKKAKKVLEVLGPFLKEHTPKVLQSDKGGEFTNTKLKELLDDLHIKHVTSLPYKPSSNGQVEHFNQTIKGMIMQYQAANNSLRYLNVLPKILKNYNTTYHTTIKSTPAEVWAGDHIGCARKNIKANVDKMLATKVKTKGVSTQVPKTGDYVW